MTTVSTHAATGTATWSATGRPDWQGGRYQLLTHADHGLTLQDAAVERWSGLHGGAFEQPDPALRGTYLADAGDGMPAVQFDAGRWMVAHRTHGGSFVSLVVCQPPANACTYRAYSPSNLTSSAYVATLAGNACISAQPQGTSLKDAPAAWWGSGWVVFRHQSDGTIAGHRLFANGVEIPLTPGVVSTDPGTARWHGDLYLNTFNDAGTLSAGCSYRTFCWMSPLPSQAEIERLEGQLAAKWGLAL